MIKRICDRCEKEIKGNYWTVSIYEHEDNLGRHTTEGAENNMQQNLNKQEYCKSCIDEIKGTIERCG